jgi:hypothetical protein
MFGILLIAAGTAGGLTLRDPRFLTSAWDFLSGTMASCLTRFDAGGQSVSHQFC